jgi:hypothetical protein
VGEADDSATETRNQQEELELKLSKLRNHFFVARVNSDNLYFDYPPVHCQSKFPIVNNETAPSAIPGTWISFPFRNEKAVYQCMFYRGQPPVPRTKTHTEWDYEFACLVAYDASKEQSLVKAWEAVRPEVRAGCWDSANIFVMVLPS